MQIVAFVPTPSIDAAVAVHPSDVLYRFMLDSIMRATFGESTPRPEKRANSWPRFCINSFLGVELVLFGVSQEKASRVATVDIERFTEFKTGVLEPVVGKAGRRGWAFVPNRLPTMGPMRDELWSVVADAQQAVGSLEQVKGILQEPFLLLGPLQQREAVISSRLEGTYTLPEDLLLFDVEQEENDAVRIPANQRGNENLEVWNHYEALRQGHNWLRNGKPLDKSLILHLHKILMTGVRGKDKSPGKFRDCQVAVGQYPRKFVPPPPDRIESCMDQLEEYIASDETNALIKSYAVHYQFEAIHPFQDGNGRVGRVLLSLCVSSWLNLSMPWLYMSEFFESHKREYSDRLFGVSTNGEWAEWLAFCMQGTIEQSLASIRRCEHLRFLRDHYYAQVQGLGPRLREIVDMLFVRPMIRTAKVAERCGVTEETARQDIKKMVDLGILSVRPKTRPRSFACIGIIDAVYGDPPADDASEHEPPSSQSPPVTKG